jgi:hypothetical protein
VKSPAEAPPWRFKRWFWALPIVLLCASVWWFSTDAARTGPPSDAKAAPLRTITSESAPPVTGNARDRASEVAVAPSGSVHEAKTGKAKTTDAGYEVEVCGFGKWNSASGPIPWPVQVTSNEPSVHTALSRLLQSKDEVDRALAHYLKASLAKMAAQEENRVRNPKRCDSRPEAERPACWDAEHALESAALNKAAGPLVDLATNTKNPDVYAMALHLCFYRMYSICPAEGACAKISAQQFAALDPKNAYAHVRFAGETDKWQFLGNTPTDGLSPSKIYAAALAAPEFNLRLPPFHRLLDDDGIRQESIPIRHAIAAWLSEQRRTLDNNGHTMVRVRCDLETRIDGQIPDYCEPVQERLRAYPTRLADLDAAASIAAAGWSAEKIAAEKAEREKLRNLSYERDRGPHWFSCEGMKHRLSIIPEELKYGELEAVRRYAKRKEASK